MIKRDINDSLAFNISRAGVLLRRDLTKVLSDYSMTPEQWQIMMILGLSNEPVNQKFITQSLMKDNVVNLMARMAENLSITIQKASVNSILSYDALEEEISSKLLTNLHYIDHLDLENTISNKFLITYCKENDINSLNIFNTKGKKLYTNNPEHNINRAQPIIKEFISNGNEKLIIGTVQSKHSNQTNFAVAIKRSNGGSIVSNINASRLTNFQKELGIGKFIDTISEDSSIVYITIQDTIGILASSHNLDSLSRIIDDRFLYDIYTNNNFKWRFLEFSDQQIFEGILPFKVQDVDYGLIRIALNTEPIQIIQKETMKNVIIKIIILLTISFILFAYSISSQNIFILEKEKEKLSAMGELAAGVAHEIRNPLNAISMSVQRIGLKFKPKTDVDLHNNLIKTIRKEIKRITEIIEQFLQFAKPAPIQTQNISINDLIQNTLELYKHNIEQKEINLIWQNPGIIKVNLDPDKIKQCLINLLENAIVATPKGGSITIELIRYLKNAIITINDTGDGIEYAKRMKLIVKRIIILIITFFIVSF